MGILTTKVDLSNDYYHEATLMCRLLIVQAEGLWFSCALLAS